jgi:hypothetical protein
MCVGSLPAAPAAALRFLCVKPDSALAYEEGQKQGEGQGQSQRMRRTEKSGAGAWRKRTRTRTPFPRVGGGEVGERGARKGGGCRARKWGREGGRASEPASWTDGRTDEPTGGWRGAISMAGPTGRANRPGQPAGPTGRAGARGDRPASRGPRAIARLALTEPFSEEWRM